MTQAHTSRKHARLAPSAAHRWMHCPGSVRATEGLPDDTSEAAALGTAAHELAAQCLEWGHEPEAYLGKYVDIKADKMADRFLDTPFDTDDDLRFFEVDEEMVDGVSTYVDFVRSLPGELEVEQKLDITHIHRDIFGTGDALKYDEPDAHLHVADFKYGKGVVVEAEENPQAVLYGSGAARRYHNRKIEKLTVYVVQPRAAHPDGPIRKYEIDLIGLFEHEDALSAAAAATDDPKAPLCAGPWCHDTFCKIQGTCAVNREAQLKAAADDFGAIDLEALPAPEAMSPEHRGRILRNADSFFNWVKAVQEFEHARACNGDMPAGFKLVAKRAVRKWRDEELAKAALYDLGATNDDILTEPRLKSPAQLENKFPGKNKEQRQKAMADLVVKQSSGVNLVPEGDPRPAVNIGAGADFGAVDVG